MGYDVVDQSQSHGGHAHSRLIFMKRKTKSTLKSKPVVIEKIGITKTESVMKHTNKNWDEWVEILSKVGAHQWAFKEIVAFLKKKYKLTPWWQYVITMGYEIHIGRRMEGQNQKGRYTVTATKTAPLGQKKLWTFLTSEEGLNIWLKPLSPVNFKAKTSFEVPGEIYGEIRTMKAPTRARLSWNDQDWDKTTFVQLYLAPRNKDKCLLAFQHENLMDARAKEKMRLYWKGVMDELAEAFTKMT